MDNALPQSISLPLSQHVRNLPVQTFEDMGIGRGDSFRLDKSFRRDKSCWLTGEHQAEHDYLSWMENLRLEVNKQLFMGLFDYEAHFLPITHPKTSINGTSMPLKDKLIATIGN